MPISSTGNSQGFSLIELIVVLVIAGLAVGVAMPRLVGALGSQQYRADMRDLVTLLRGARARAASEHQPAGVWIDVEHKTFGRDGGARTWRLPEETEVELKTIAEQVVSDRIAKIRFFPDGTSSGAELTTVYRGQRLRLDVSWITGRIRLQ